MILKESQTFLPLSNPVLQYPGFGGNYSWSSWMTISFNAQPIRRLVLLGTIDWTQIFKAWPMQSDKNRFGDIRRVGDRRMRQNEPAKQWELTACNKVKNSVLCSGYSSKSLLIISKVHSNTASKISGTALVRLSPRRLTTVAMVPSTSGSLDAGTPLL